MRRLGAPSERLLAGVIPPRIGDPPAPEAALVRGGAGPAPMVSPTGFVMSLPNRSPARVRGLRPRSLRVR